MAGSFSIQARQHWMPLHCSTWLQPQDAPYDVAHELMAHPSCCV